MLPTDLLQNATTMDFMIFYNASILKDRYQRQNRGDNVADTYSQAEIDKVYANFKKGQDKTHGDASKR